MQVFLALLLALPLVALAQKPAPWELEPSETTADLRGVHAVGGGVVWASGTSGTVLRSQDSGFEWQNCATPPGAEKLDFRAIWAWDDQTAIVMSSGTGSLSRVYKTTDGCAHWTLLYANPDKDGFWDAMVFQSREKGFILGDPVEGRFAFLSTTDGGEQWSRSAAPELSSGPEATGAFAASNTALLAGLREPVMFGTGGGSVYAESFTGSIPLLAPKADKPTPIKMQDHWEHTATPLASKKESAGVFSLGYRAWGSSGHGFTLLAVGGNYTEPMEREGTAAWSEDGKQWTASAIPPGGYRSAVAWDAGLKLWITVGPNGSDISQDDGRTWQPLECAPADAPKGGEWNALSLPWAVGPHGRIGKLNPEALRQ